MFIWEHTQTNDSKAVRQLRLLCHPELRIQMESEASERWRARHRNVRRAGFGNQMSAIADVKLSLVIAFILGQACDLNSFRQ